MTLPFWFLCKTMALLPTGVGGGGSGRGGWGGRVRGKRKRERDPWMTTIRKILIIIIINGDTFINTKELYIVLYLRDKLIVNSEYVYFACFVIYKQNA